MECAATSCRTSRSSRLACTPRSPKRVAGALPRLDPQPRRSGLAKLDAGNGAPPQQAKGTLAQRRNRGRQLRRSRTRTVTRKTDGRGGSIARGARRLGPRAAFLLTSPSERGRWIEEWVSGSGTHSGRQGATSDAPEPPLVRQTQSSVHLPGCGAGGLACQEPRCDVRGGPRYRPVLVSQNLEAGEEPGQLVWLEVERLIARSPAGRSMSLGEGLVDEDSARLQRLFDRRGERPVELTVFEDDAAARRPERDSVRGFEITADCRDDVSPA